MTSAYRSRPSQALITLVMVMAVSLVIGVAISTRVVTTLRQISYSEQSAKALSFAESGAEQALQRLKGECVAPYTDLSKCGPFEVDLDGDGVRDFSYRISEMGGTDTFDGFTERDKAVQVDLEGYNGSVSVYWVDGDRSEETTPAKAAMEISVVYRDPATGPYKLWRGAYDPEVLRASGNRFLSTFVGGVIDGVNYQHRVSITLPNNSKILRLRPIYNGTSFAVVGSAPLPSQGELIESTGYYGEIQRKVEVVRADPALSELFDFVIFSSGSQPIP